MFYLCLSANRMLKTRTIYLDVHWFSLVTLAEFVKATKLQHLDAAGHVAQQCRHWSSGTNASILSATPRGE